MLFVEALGRPVAFFTISPAHTPREMARQVAQPLFVLCRAPSRERGRLMARHRGVFLTAPGRALQGPSVAPALASRFWAKHTAGGRPPRARLLADGS